MHVTQITLQVNSNITQSLLDYLNNFSKNDLKIITKQEISVDELCDKSQKVDISQMGGFLAKYIDKPISDRDIEEAITQGIVDRAYKK
ncbi:hypothetical protein [Moraxella sp. VT-16-12]|uniref:hypothetical protein n=1 Tax=Moraxella sp. VT-16-12 TaxID=2014877 RepID=UPI000B7E34E9|nr:hypothetical protein [Moraxella sp. VT-16-12]TWV83906.1 hypothetical protein CEW93_001880 [Moraxella sp. VT-16-12]